jgi:hypothetical protein
MEIIPVLLLLLALFARAWFGEKFGPNYRKQRLAALEEFRNYKTSSASIPLVFDGAKAAIIHEKADATFDIQSKTYINYRKSIYAFTFYAQNEEGEYFMYVFNLNAAPYFKHISQSNAKIVLGKKYLAPQSKI